MGTALITLKLMPNSPEANLEAIKEQAKETIEQTNGKNVRFEEIPVAFGLKAIQTFFDLDEAHELEPIENALGEIKNISSVQFVDMRRAFG